MSDAPSTTQVTSVETPKAQPAILETKPNEIKTETKVTETPKEPVIDPKTFKRTVTIDGKKVEVTLEQLEKDYQIKKVSDDKMMTATAIERKAAAMLEQIEKDPEGFLASKYGDKVNEVAERIIAKRLEREMETPEQRELRELREYKAQKEEQDQLDAKQKEEAAHQEAKAKYAQEYSSQIKDVLETSGLPYTSGTVRRVAYYMEQSLKRAIEAKDPSLEKSAKDVIGLVKADYINDIKELTQGWSASQIEENFGSEMAEKLRKATFEKIKTPQDNLKTPSKQAVKDGQEQKRKRIPLSQWGRS